MLDNAFDIKSQQREGVRGLNFEDYAGMTESQKETEDDFW